MISCPNASVNVIACALAQDTQSARHSIIPAAFFSIRMGCFPLLSSVGFCNAVGDVADSVPVSLQELLAVGTVPYSYTQMCDGLSVVNDADTRMLDITFKSPSPEEAAAVANEYAKVASQYIADTMSTDKPNIMSVALVPSNPVSPNKTKNVMLGFLLGAVLACGYITIQMIMDDKYKTAEDIRRYTGMATLAIVPIEETNSKKNRKAAGGKHE